MYDCLILGGGLAGFMAAREIVSAGLRPLLVQDGQGASPWVHGFNVPVRKGDSADVFYNDTIASGQGLSNPALAKALCGDARTILDELEGMGLRFNRDGNEYQALRPLGASFPRVVSIGNETGAAVLARLREQLAGKVDELPKTRALRLLKRGERVCGALVYDTRSGIWRTLSAKAVVLACGGFCGVYPMSTNKRDSGGDGIAMAYKAGATLCDMEFIQFEPSGAVWPRSLIGTSMITTLFFEGAVLRNREGERFMLRYGSEAERVGKDVLARCIAAEINAGRGTGHGGVYFDATAVGRDTLERDYAMYVERYRRVGIDLSKEPIEIAPMPHTSLGGVCIDAAARTSVEGLFACGEVTGGLHGANRIGGSAGLETLVFGRRAGKSAAEYVRTASADEPEEEPITHGDVSAAATLTALRQRVQQSLWSALNATRNGASLRRAIGDTLDCLRHIDALACGSDAELFDKERLFNDTLTALLAMRSALARDGSLGCHVRSDAPNPQPLYRVVLRRRSRYETVIQKESLNV